MSKKPSLAESLGKITNAAVSTSIQHAKLDHNAAKSLPEYSNKQNQPPSRVGKKPVTGFFEPDVSKQLKLIALNNDITIQSLVTEAINDLFIKYGKAAIAK